MRNKAGAKGFLFTLEAASAFLLLALSASLLPALSFPENSPSGFFACSDAAILLSKLRPADSDALQQAVDSMHELSGLCVSAESDFAHASSKCEGSSKEKFSFSFPAWHDGKLAGMHLSCWRT